MPPEQLGLHSIYISTWLCIRGQPLDLAHLWFWTVENRRVESAWANLQTASRYQTWLGSRQVAEGKPLKRPETTSHFAGSSLAKTEGQVKKFQAQKARPVLLAARAPGLAGQRLALEVSKWVGGRN